LTGVGDIRAVLLRPFFRYACQNYIFCYNIKIDLGLFFEDLRLSLSLYDSWAGKSAKQENLAAIIRFGAHMAVTGMKFKTAVLNPGAFGGLNIFYESLCKMSEKFKNDAVLHTRLENYIRAQLNSEEWFTNMKIPSENSLCEEFGISRTTVRRVISKLCQEGLLYSIAGKGTFVAKRTYMLKSLSENSFRHLVENNSAAKTSLLGSYPEKLLDSEIAYELKIPIGSDVYITKSLLSLHDLPLSYNVGYFPLDLFSNIDWEFQNYMRSIDYIRSCGHIVHQREYSLVFHTQATEEDAQHLQIPVASDLILVKQKYISPDGQIYSYTMQKFIPDKFQFKIFLSE